MSPTVFTLVSRTLGVLLLAAAALKLHGLGADPVGRFGIFSTPEFQLAVVEFEIFLGIWLLWGKRPAGSWLLAVATFFGFAAVSFYQGWVGQTSCGCFGRLSVSPWYGFGLDMVVLAALVVARPGLRSSPGQSGASLKGALAPAAAGLAGIIVTSGLLIGLATIGFGSVRAAIAHFRGERISIEPRLVDLGEGDAGALREVSVEVTNWTDLPIRLVGGTADCSCTVLNDLPVTIPAKETRSVTIRVRLPKDPGIFTRMAAFLVNEEGFSNQVSFRMTGRIR